MFSLLRLSKGFRLKDKQDHTCDSTQQDFARAPSMRHMCDTPFFCHLYCATALFYDAFPSPLLSIHPGFLDHIPPCLELSCCSSCVELLPTVIRSNILSASTALTQGTQLALTAVPLCRPRCRCPPPRKANWGRTSALTGTWTRWTHRQQFPNCHHC